MPGINTMLKWTSIPYVCTLDLDKVPTPGTASNVTFHSSSNQSVRNHSLAGFQTGDHKEQIQSRDIILLQFRVLDQTKEGASVNSIMTPLGTIMGVLPAGTYLMLTVNL